MTAQARPSVQPKATTPAQSSQKAHATSSSSSSNSSANSSVFGRGNDLPLVELFEDETYGQETTNGGDKPLNMESEGTEVDATAKIDRRSGGR
jgi:hypothetical protein